MSDDEIDAIRAWRPPDAPAADDGSIATARQRLAAHIAGRTGTPPPRRRRRLVIAIPGLVTAAVLATVLVLGSGADDGRVLPQTATALESSARNFERTATGTTLGNRRGFLYTRSSGTVEGCSVSRIRGTGGMLSVCARERSEREDWVSPHTDGLILERRGRIGWMTAEDRQRWIAAGRPDVSRSFPVRRSRTPLPPSEVYVGNEQVNDGGAALSRLGPNALYQRIYDGVEDGQGESRAGEAFTQIADALREGLIVPQLQANLYRALAHVPGVLYRGDERDRLGRAVNVFAKTDAGSRHELLLDPSSGAMLGERKVLAEDRPASGDPAPPAQKAGTVIEDMLIIRRAVVAARGDRP